MALTDTDKILGQIYFDPGHVAGFKGKIGRASCRERV